MCRLACQATRVVQRLLQRSVASLTLAKLDQCSMIFALLISYRHSYWHRDEFVHARLEGGRFKQSSRLPAHLDALAEAARSRLRNPASSAASSSAAHRRTHLDWTSACGYTAALQDETARHSLNAAVPNGDSTRHGGGILRVPEANNTSGGAAGKGLGLGWLSIS